MTRDEVFDVIKSHFLEIVEDIEAKYVNSITLSYTFHQTELPEQQASLAPGPETQVKKAQ